MSKEKEALYQLRINIKDEEVIAVLKNLNGSFERRYFLEQAIKFYAKSPENIFAKKESAIVKNDNELEELKRQYQELKEKLDSINSESSKPILSKTEDNF